MDDHDTTLFFSDLDNGVGDSLFDNVVVPEPHDTPTSFQEKLCFVPYRWWIEAHKALSRDTSEEVKGVFYTAETKIRHGGSGGFYFDSEIVLSMTGENGPRERNGAEEGDGTLIAEWMFLRAVKWHNDMKDVGGLLSIKNSMPDLFLLQIELSVSWDSSSLVVKIPQKDNDHAAFHKACDVFHVDSGLWGIWDFSGQATQFLALGRNKISDDTSCSDELIHLELQVYGSAYLWKIGDGRKDQMAAEPSSSEDSFSLLIMNGSTDHVNPSFRFDKHLSGSCYMEACTLGLAGLHNMGNTCFMNSAIQCLVHTPDLVDFFLGDYKKDINTQNPLGMNGELAFQFGDLFRKLWAPGATAVAPRAFKSKLANFAPQFSGYNQHDSQEFLAFLLDGLHEDLNRVKIKPYIEAKDLDGRADEEAAEECWQTHIARNDSIVVDLCQGQYRSKLVCPVCKKLSTTFDPFMYLSLPLPSTTMRTMTLTVSSTDGTFLPYPITITLPKYGTYKDILQALSTACSLQDNETLLVAEIFNNRVLSFLDKPSDSLELIRDGDKLVAYRLPKCSEMSCLVVFMHENLERDFVSSMFPKLFGVPLVARISDLSRGSEIRKGFMRLLCPFLLPVEDFLSDNDDSDQNSAKKDTESSSLLGGLCSDIGSEDDSTLDSDFLFYWGGERVFVSKGSKIEMNEPVAVTSSTKMLNVIVSWSDEMIKLYDTCLLSHLPQICKPGVFTKPIQEHVSLYKCLEAFLKEEPLGPEDMWYCPNCEKHQQASKKLDIWRLPEILIIHLKRFSYSRYFKNKLETFVDFPIDDLDLSSYMPHKNARVSHCYELYAVSNHYGGLGGGHYTAFTQHENRVWYEFDDSHVSLVSEDQIKTSAAYVLFYRRRLSSHTTADI